MHGCGVYEVNERTIYVGSKYELLVTGHNLFYFFRHAFPLNLLKKLLKSEILLVI